MAAGFTSSWVVAHTCRFLLPAFMMLCFLCAFGLSSRSFGVAFPSTEYELVESTPSTFDAPSLTQTYRGVTVSVTVFCCRSFFFEILDLYLHNNLRTRGGIVNEVVWVMKTKDQAAWDHVSNATANTPGYRMVDRRTERHFSRLYDVFEDDSTVYLKIDDDIVYIAPDALKTMVDAHLDVSVPSMAKPSSSPTCLVSANVVNHPRMSHFHQQIGALVSQTPTDPTNFRKKFIPTPAGETALYYEDDPYGTCSLYSGLCTIVAHNNFFEHMHNGTLDSYKNIGSDSRLHILDRSAEEYIVLPHTRWSINAMVMTKQIVESSGILRLLPDNPDYIDDENFLTVTWPNVQQCSSAAVLDALVVHFSYLPQALFVYTKSDHLQRYRQLAMRLYGDPHGYFSKYTPVKEIYEL